MDSGSSSDTDDTMSGCLTPTSLTSESALPSVIDYLGDLRLRIGRPDTQEATTRVFQVCSRSIARNSPVFAKLLFENHPQQEDVRKNHGWLIELPDEDVDAMEQLLHLMHSNFSRFTLGSKFAPSRNVEHLYHFFVVVDKYNCIELVQPWVASWVCELEKIIICSNEKIFMLSWIYFQLGHQAKYEEVATRLIMNSKSWGLQPGLSVLPPGLPQNITDSRKRELKKVIDYLKGLFDDLTKANDEERAATLQEKYDLCTKRYTGKVQPFTDRMLGALIRELSQHDFWPLPKPSEVDMSVVGARVILSSIKSKLRPQDHSCIVLNAVPRSIPFKHDLQPVRYIPSDREIRYMSSQAERTGLVNG